MCVQGLEDFIPACAESRKNSLMMAIVESLLNGVGSWLLRCDAMRDVVLLQTVIKVLHIEHV